jgi:hypothetical protein
VGDYEFRYFSATSLFPAFERVDLASDGAARAKAAAELLRLPHRAAVEVWRGTALVYSRRRRDAVLNRAGDGTPV